MLHHMLHHARMVYHILHIAMHSHTQTQTHNSDMDKP